MSAVRQLIDYLLSTEAKLQQRVATLVPKICSLSLCDLQQFIRELSFLLYRKQPLCSTQLTILELLKSLLITGSFIIYLLVNVYICPWVISVNQLHKDRNMNKRAELMFRDAAGLNFEQRREGVESYLELLQFAGEFLVFFAENLKFHPYSKYKIKQCLAKQLEQGSYSRSLEFFIQKDTLLLQRNLKNYSPQFRQHLNKLTQFLSDTVQQCLTDPTKYQDNSFLLLSLIQMSQSYCITAIIYRTCSFLTPETVLTACQFLHSVASLAQLESIEIINSKCLPLILEYLLPIDFKNNRVLSKVKKTLSSEVLTRLADYYFIWYDKTKIMGLSTRIYEYSYKMVSQLKKPNKLTYQPQLKEFIEKANRMKSNNEAKRSFVIDQNQQIQRFTINLLKQAQFCINSQQRQQVAYQNVLDSLTLSEKENSKINSFSQSLVRSLQQRQEESQQLRKAEKLLKGPPHKKFGKLQSSIREVKETPFNLNKKKSTLSKYSQQSSQNIYYTRSSPKMPHFSRLSSSKQKSQLPFGINHQRFQHSSRQVHQPSARTVNAKYSTPQKTPVQSPQNSMFLNSSQYSQKDNLQKNKISSIYLNKSSSESGQFLNFQKDSIAKSQVKQAKFKVQRGKEIDYDIQFQDSMKLQQSQSQELVEYGMDKGAKLPITEKKPPFGFKQAQTNDQSSILKDISLVDKFSIKKSSEQHKELSPEESPLLLNNLKDSRPDEYLLQKRTEKTKAAPKSQDYRSPTKQSQRLDTIKSPKSININQPEPEPQFSQSQIRQLSVQPYSQSASNSISSSGKIPSNFGSFIRRTHKKQKASSISSSRSLRRIKIPSKQVQIPDFKKMRDLQNQLGRLKQQTENYSKLLTQKSRQKKQLEAKKEKLVEQDPYFLKRQNQLIKTMLKIKNKEEPIVLSRGSGEQLAKQLKESSIKNCTMSLKDYNPDVLKIRMENIHGYSKGEKKNMVANRCVILKNESIQIGYSLKNKIVTLYFTLKHHCESLEIQLHENSLIYSESIQRQFDKVFVGKQMKFKTEVEGTKDINPFVKSSIAIKLSYEQKMSKRVEEYSAELPLTPYNIADPVPSDELSSLSQSQQSISHYVTPLYSSCQDLLKKRQKYLEYLFPHGQFDPDTNTFTVGYLWKQKVQNIRIKLKQRAFRFEGSGTPLETGRQLIQALINMLVDTDLSE